MSIVYKMFDLKSYINNILYVFVFVAQLATLPSVCELALKKTYINIYKFHSHATYVTCNVAKGGHTKIDTIARNVASMLHRVAAPYETPAKPQQLF